MLQTRSVTTAPPRRKPALLRPNASLRAGWVVAVTAATLGGCSPSPRAATPSDAGSALPFDGPQSEAAATRDSGGSPDTSTGPMPDGASDGPAPADVDGSPDGSAPSPDGASPDGGFALGIPVTVHSGTTSSDILVDVTIGGSGPVTLLVDTGSSGVRVVSGQVAATGWTDTGLAAPSATFGGSLVTGGEIHDRRRHLPRGRRRPRRVDGADSPTVSCTAADPNCAGKSGDASSIRFGGSAVGLIGIGMRQSAVLSNALVALSPSKQYVVSIGPYGSTSGTIWVGPGGAELARFSGNLAALTTTGTTGPGGISGWNDLKVPFCLNAFCGTTLFDTGGQSAKLVVSSPSEFMQLGVPNGSATIPSGTFVNERLGEHRSGHLHRRGHARGRSRRRCARHRQRRGQQQPGHPPVLPGRRALRRRRGHDRGRREAVVGQMVIRRAHSPAAAATVRIERDAAARPDGRCALALRSPWVVALPLGAWTLIAGVSSGPDAWHDLVRPAFADEAPPPDVPSSREDPARHEIDRTSLYGDDARVPLPMTVVATTSLSYTNIGSDPTQVSSPYPNEGAGCFTSAGVPKACYSTFAGNTAQPGGQLIVSGELGLFPRVSILGSVMAGAGGPGRRSQPRCGRDRRGARSALSPFVDPPASRRESGLRARSVEPARLR